jgi:Uma2 family endonuclease
VIPNTDWETYTKLLKAFAERPRVKLTYDRGDLEIMAPSLEHDDDGDVLGDFVKILAEAFGLPLHRGGSVTLRRRRMKKGLEPDRCFWIASAPRMAGVRKLDLRIHPPPDLAIEVDVSRSSLDRVGIYTALRVSELWRLDGDELRFFTLDPNGHYEEISTSRSFPRVTPADLLSFLLRARVVGDQTPVIVDFREWAKRAASSQSPPAP